MGFGSGGGGFTPSPNNVPGSTQTGTDKDTDLHQFTGSVDITGSLTLNGASVTSGGGGGGGAVSTYTNSGNDRVITSVNSNTINGEANLTFNGTSLTSPQVTASVIMKTPALEISSSAAGALFRIDHADQSGPEPILFVSGSGVIGIGTDNPLASTPSDNTNRLHIVGNNGAEQGEAPVINTQLVLENDNHAGLQFMMPSGRSGQITWGIPGAARKAVFYWSSANSRYEFNGDSFGGKRIMTMLSNGDSINIGSSSSGHMTTNKASLHISSSEGGADKGGPVLLRVDHGDQPGAEPTLFVSGSGQVGIGTASPSSILHVSSSTTTLPLLRVDQHDQAGAKPILYVTGSGLVAIGTDSPRSDTSDTNRLHILAESGADQGINPAVNSALVLENNDHVGLNIITPNNRSGMIVFGDADVANRAYFRYEHGNAGQGAGTDRFFFDGTFGEEVLSIARAGDSINMGKNNSAHMLTNKASLHISSSTEGADVGGPVLLKVDHANQPGAQPILFVTGSGRVGIGTDVPEHTLSVSGSAAFSGTFGSTAIETLTAAGTISATTGLTIIDASSSLAVNNTLNFTIANGTFVGQEKKIRAMIKSGSTGPLSTGIAIGGANIDSAGDVPVGQIVLSGNLPDNGPLFHRAGCSLIWGGTKWLPVGNFNFNINNTGRSFI
jgi:hypothetical protein